MSRMQDYGGQEGFGRPNRAIGYYNLYGNWTAGVALSLYKIHYPGFCPLYTKLGILLYKLKYDNDVSVLDVIAQDVATAIKSLEFYPEIDAIIPVPPSKLNRKFQPVAELSKHVSKYTGIPVELKYLVKVKETLEMKKIKNVSKKLMILRSSYAITTNKLEGKTVLLIDDLCKTGATLRACTDILLSEGKVGKVYVLTVAKTWPCSDFEIKKVHCEMCRRILERFNNKQK